MADNSESHRRLERGAAEPDQGVLRAHDVIPPYGPERSEGKVIIPKFDLSREIMAGHRQATAEKRQGPGEKAGGPERRDSADGRDCRVERLQSERTGEDRVLAEIVARDIARLCGTAYSGRT